MKKYLLLLATFAMSLHAVAQPYAIGSTTITFIDPSRSNRAIETDVYYPALAAGSNAAIAGVAGDRFPVVAFGHGFVMTVGAYQNIWSSLVPNGYIVALPKTEGSFLPSHTNFGRDLAFVISALQEAGSTNGNFFFKKVAKTSAVMGHSMGGGAATLAVQYNPAITALAGLAPAETNPSASAAAQGVTIPSLIFAGGNDCVTPAAQHSQLIYDNLSSACKTYINIIGGSHCQFANSNFNCSFGELTCSPSAAISRAVQQAKVNQYLLPWFDFRLKGDCQDWYSLQGDLSADASVTFSQTCPVAFNCTPPEGRRTNWIRARSAVLKWIPTNCYESYEIRWRQAGTTAWTNVSVGTSNTYYLRYLTPGTNYEWGVRGYCDASGTQFSTFGPLQTFTTLLTNPPARLGEAEETDFNIVIYPNPANDKFEVQLTGAPESEMTVEVYNIVGGLIQRKSVTMDSEINKVSFDLSNNASGLYFIKAGDGINVVTQKLLLQ
jgi:hypothetical protein